VIAPEFDDATTERTATLLRIQAATLWFVGRAFHGTGILQAHERFGRAAEQVWRARQRLSPGLRRSLQATACRGPRRGLLLGSFAQFVVVWFLLLREGMPVFSNPLRHRGSIAVFARQTLPFLSHAGAAQGALIVYRVSASTLGTGVYAALSFASRLHRALFSLIFLRRRLTRRGGLPGTRRRGRGHKRPM
jgi:peptidoglycan biosynthesis protein MviN/MurJ (putative lipid II flippase)